MNKPGARRNDFIGDVYRYLADRYGWGPDVVGRMTPQQISMYAAGGVEANGPAREDFASFLTRKFGRSCHYRSSKG